MFVVSVTIICYHVTGSISMTTIDAIVSQILKLRDKE